MLRPIERPIDRSLSRWLNLAPVARQLRGSEALASPPPAVALLVSHLGGEAGVDELGQLLKENGVLRSKFTTLADSPMFGARRRADNLHKAIVQVGISGSIHMCAALAFVDLFREHAQKVLPWKQHWSRGIAAAIAARALCLRTAPERADSAFVAALVQDIGTVVLARLAPELYEVSLSGELPYRDEARAAESEWFDICGPRVGAWLLERWGLSDDIQVAIAHAPALVNGGDVRTENPLAVLVALSGLIADMWMGSSEKNVSQRAVTLAREGLGMTFAELRAILNTVGALAPSLGPVFGVGVAPEVSGRSTGAAPSMLPASGKGANGRTAESARPCLDRRQRPEVVLENEFKRARSNVWPISIGRIRLEARDSNDSSSTIKRILCEGLQTIEETVRPTDSIAQNDAGEYILVMPGTDDEGASAAAQRILRLIRQSRDCADRITCAIGIATDAENSRFASVSDFLSAAGRALEGARVRGGHSYVSARPLDG